MQFIRTDSVFAIRQEPHSGKPLLKRKRRVLEDCSDLERELRARMAAVAFPDPRILQVGYMVGIALRAPHDAIRPPCSHHIALAVLVVGEELNRFEQRFRGIIGALHGQHSTLKKVVCQVLYLVCSQSLSVSLLPF